MFEIMELELKHIAAYLPYGLKAQGVTHGEIVEITGLNSGTVMIDHNTRGWADFFDIKPLLRPLSDLTKEFFISEFNAANESNDNYRNMVDIWTFKSPDIFDNTQHWIVQELIKRHFDIYGLIEANLAVDINTIEL